MTGGFLPYSGRRVPNQLSVSPRTPESVKAGRARIPQNRSSLYVSTTQRGAIKSHASPGVLWRKANHGCMRHAIGIHPLQRFGDKRTPVAHGGVDGNPIFVREARPVAVCGRSAGNNPPSRSDASLLRRLRQAMAARRSLQKESRNLLCGVRAAVGEQQHSIARIMTLRFHAFCSVKTSPSIPARRETKLYIFDRSFRQDSVAQIKDVAGPAHDLDSKCLERQTALASNRRTGQPDRDFPARRRGPRVPPRPSSSGMRQSRPMTSAPVSCMADEQGGRVGSKVDTGAPVRLSFCTSSRVRGKTYWR